jgi:hypothetical protein
MPWTDINALVRVQGMQSEQLPALATVYDAFSSIWQVAHLPVDNCSTHVMYWSPSAAITGLIYIGVPYDQVIPIRQ